MDASLSRDGATAEISVVVATRDRPHRLTQLLEALRRQSIGTPRFEVVIVDDGSGSETRDVLDAERRRGDLRLTVVGQTAPAGPATARDLGWRAAQGGLVAFTDDDCVPDADWLLAGLDAARANPGAIVQGHTEPAPWERQRAGAFSRTIEVRALDPAFQTCNVFYPREILERVGGFDVEAFGRSPGGEDSDLAWRAIGSGAGATFAGEARVYHAVNDLGPLGKLRVAARWTTPMLAYVRHPELRRAHFAIGVFWKGSHYLLVRLLVAALLPRRLRWLRPWMIAPYLRQLSARAAADGHRVALVPYLALHDLVELVAVVRAAIRYRRLML